MQDSQKWQNMLDEVKRKGKRRLFVKRSISSALALLVFVLGIWQLLFVSASNSGQSNYKDAEMVFYSEDSVVYDRDFGYVTVSLDE